MKKLIKGAVAAAVGLQCVAMASAVQAADSVNVAFFLEWATPNQIAKVDKVYDEAMGVDVNWTDFSTGVAMTEAMLVVILISPIHRVWHHSLQLSSRVRR